jgi:hypothetical protein
LQWLGFFGQPDPSGCSYIPSVQSSFANLGTSENVTALVEGQTRGMTGLYRSQNTLVHSVFDSSGNWIGKRLFSDYQKRWAALAEQLQPYVANGTVRGFHIGDELCWGGLPFVDLDKVRGLLIDPNRLIDKGRRCSKFSKCVLDIYTLILTCLSTLSALAHHMCLPTLRTCSPQPDGNDDRIYTVVASTIEALDSVLERGCWADCA